MKSRRYIKQIQLHEFGREGQQRLKNAAVLVVGLGGLGIPVIQYLNAMGIGRLGLVDRDKVDISNLHRQVLYDEADIGQPKVTVCIRKLSAQNPETRLEGHNAFLSPENALDIMASYDLIVDASDNFPTRYLINDACVLLNKPFVYGALHGFEGQVSVLNFYGGPTYRCLFPDMPGMSEVPNCDENGVLGILPGIVGNFQALEAVKVITGKGDPLSGKLLLYNGLNSSLHKISFPLKPENLNITGLRDAYQIPSCPADQEIDALSLVEQLKSDASGTLIDVRSTSEYQLHPISKGINIPLAQLEKEPIPLEKGQNVYLICQSGVRSLQAKAMLESLYPGINFINVRGGLDQLQSEKIKV